jgi:hypothetical protein
MIDTHNMPATVSGVPDVTDNTVTGNRDREGTGNIHALMKSPLTRYGVNSPPVRAVLVDAAFCRPGVMEFH